MKPIARRLVLGFAALPLAGCGFTPLYATNEGPNASPGVTAALANMQITPIADRDGMKLRQTLRERLQPSGPGERPRYVLDVQMRSRTDELGVRKDATAAHANLIYTARFSLNAGGQRIFTDVVQSIVSYNILDDQYATVAAIGNASDRAIKQIGDEIKIRLAIFLEGRLRQTASAQ